MQNLFLPNFACKKKKSIWITFKINFNLFYAFFNSYINLMYVWYEYILQFIIYVILKKKKQLL